MEIRDGTGSEWSRIFGIPRLLSRSGKGFVPFEDVSPVGGVGRSRLGISCRGNKYSSTKVASLIVSVADSNLHYLDFYCG